MTAPRSPRIAECPDCKHRMDMHRKLDGCMVMVEKSVRVPRCKCERKPEPVDA